MGLKGMVLITGVKLRFSRSSGQIMCPSLASELEENSRRGKYLKDCVAHFSFALVFKERPTQLLKKRLIFFLLLPFPWMLSTRKDGEYTLLINKDYTN